MSWEKVVSKIQMLVMTKWLILHLKLTLFLREKFMCTLCMFTMSTKMEIAAMEIIVGRDARLPFRGVLQVG